MSDKERKGGGVVVGEIGFEANKTSTRFFDSANTFANIAHFISQASPGSLRDSSGAEINALDIIKVQAEAKIGLVSAESVEKITRQNGLREAVVRALAPDFRNYKGPNASETIYFVLHILQFLKSQEDVFIDGGVYGVNNAPLKILFDSSKHPVDINSYIQKVEGIITALKEDYTLSLTGSSPFLAVTNQNGLRMVLLEAISTITGDTGPISMTSDNE